MELEIKADGTGSLWSNLYSSEDIADRALVTFDLDGTIVGAVEDANADSTSKMPVIGITMSRLYPDRKGPVLLFGWIHIPGKSWANQIPLYVDEVDGGITDTDPTAATSQQVGVHAYDGWVLFSPQVYTINL